jgi:hypothetical protein
VIIIFLFVQINIKISRFFKTYRDVNALLMSLNLIPPFDENDVLAEILFIKLLTANIEI